MDCPIDLKVQQETAVVHGGCLDEGMYPGAPGSRSHDHYGGTEEQKHWSEKSKWVQQTCDLEGRQPRSMSTGPSFTSAEGLLLN